MHNKVAQHGAQHPVWLAMTPTMVYGCCTRGFQFCVAHHVWGLPTRARPWLSPFWTGSQYCQMPLCQALNNRSTSILKMNSKDQSSQTQLGSLRMRMKPLAQGSSAPSRAPATPGRRSKAKDKTGQSERPGPYTRAAPMTPGALPGDTMMAELVDGDHWRISRDVAIRVHTEPRKREYNTMVDGELPEGFQDSGFATVRKIFRNGDVKTNETGKVSSVEETDAWTGFTVFRRAQDPFERARAMDLELDLEPLRSFIAQRIEEAEETVQSGKVAKTVDIRKVSPEIKALMMEARTAEWEKYKSFNAAIPIWGKELQNLLDEGHKVIPSKCVETDKHEHLKGTPEYSPKMKARLVICDNFEDVSREDVRCDAPTADAESHCLLASWAASERLRLKGSDVTNAYFQAKPLTRLLLMRQPTGGLGDPDVPAEACLLCRVPIYGSMQVEVSTCAWIQKWRQQVWRRRRWCLPCTIIRTKMVNWMQCYAPTWMIYCLPTNQVEQRWSRRFLESSQSGRLKKEASGTVDVGLPSMMISRSKSMLRRTPEESSQSWLTSPVRELTLSRKRSWQASGRWRDHWRG